jgi:hypothetical protein
VRRSDFTDQEAAEIERMGFWRLELGFTRSEVLGLVRTAVLDAQAAGHEGRAILAYVALVCPLLPGSGEIRAWHRERNRILGRVRRSKESYRERQQQLALAL